MRKRETGCEKEQAYPAWHMPFKKKREKRRSKERRKNQSQKKGKRQASIKKRHGLQTTDCCFCLCSFILYSVSHKTKTDPFFNDSMNKPAACDLNYNIRCHIGHGCVTLGHACKQSCKSVGKIIPWDFSHNLSLSVLLSHAHIHISISKQKTFCSCMSFIIKTHKKTGFWPKGERKRLLAGTVLSSHTYQWEGPLQEACHIPAASMKTDPLNILTRKTFQFSCEYKMEGCSVFFFPLCLISEVKVKCLVWLRPPAVS